MRVDGKLLAVNGKSNFDGTFTAVNQHDGNVLAVDGTSNFDCKSPLHRDRPPVRYFYVGKFTEHLPGIFREELNQSYSSVAYCMHATKEEGISAQKYTKRF